MSNAPVRLWPFKSEQKAAPVGTPTSGLAVPEPWLTELFGGAPASGYGLTGATALTVPAVASAIALIAGSIAALDIIVERRDGSEWKRDDAHPVSVLLRDQPNDYSSTFDLVRDLVATALTDNQGGLAWVNRSGERVVEIVRYEPGSYAVEYSTDGRAEPSYRIGNRPTAASDIIHLRGPFNRCPLSLASDAIGISKLMERHAGALFSRGARPSGVIESPKQIGDEGTKRMLAGWRAAHEGASNSARTAVLFDGASFRALTFSSVDAQFLETWKHVTLEVCRAFRVPPQALYDFSRATWANAEQASKEWLASLEFWLRPLEAAMRRALFSASERPDWRIRFDRDDFSAVDLTARATAVSSLISAEVLNRNEAREWLGLGPRDGGEAFGNPHINPAAPAPASKEPGDGSE